MVSFQNGIGDIPQNRIGKDERVDQKGKKLYSLSNPIFNRLINLSYSVPKKSRKESA
jgi:hypothetical protein